MIIFLNGCGSSGKTSIAKSIQHLSDEPWIRLGVDTLIDMLPSRYMGFGDKSQDGYFSFVEDKNSQGPTIQVKIAPQGQAIFRLLPHFAKILADCGHRLIIEEVVFDDEMLKDYVQALREHTTYFIGVFCALNLMQERELLRGDRALGLSNDQIDKVHQGTRAYDLAVDTSYQSSFETAKQILSLINNLIEPTGFKKMAQVWI